jgi:hypothetical protein
MNNITWEKFIAAREYFKAFCIDTAKKAPHLQQWQEELVARRGAAPNAVETPDVYNNALEAITKSSEIKLLLVADNPGRREQAACNRSYLVGPSGKIAEGFFKKSAALDFRKNVIILNKTPIHTPRTAELGVLSEIGGAVAAALITETQKAAAKILLMFYEAFNVPVWIIGYSEMKKRGIFETYTQELAAFISQKLIKRDDVFFFRHFSMNQFTIDLNKQKQADETVEQALSRIGGAYRERIISPFMV